MLNPLNLIGELARPVSLSFRLFGNILAGMILMTLLYTMAPVVLRFIVPIPLHFYFDLFSGILQAYVFCILSLSFIGAAASTD
jgi:F-type H+-transporting ATPase subunit a